MATVEQIVTRAFRKIGVAGVGAPLDAEELQEGVDALNDMIRGWELRGVSLGYVALVSSDTFTLDSSLHDAVVHCLAGKLAPNFQVPLTFNPETYYRQIANSDHTIEAADIEGGLLTMPSSQTARKRSLYYGL